jgi:hypothetical protein
MLEKTVYIIFFYWKKKIAAGKVSSKKTVYIIFFYWKKKIAAGKVSSKIKTLNFL